LEHPKTLARLRDTAARRRDQLNLSQTETLLATAFDVQRRVSGNQHPGMFEDALLLGEAP